MNNGHVIWSSKTNYIDMYTGELTTENDVISGRYYVYATKKHVTLNSTQTRGTIIYTRECRENPQLKLFNNG